MEQTILVKHWKKTFEIVLIIFTLQCVFTITILNPFVRCNFNPSLVKSEDPFSMKHDIISYTVLYIVWPSVDLAKKV